MLCCLLGCCALSNALNFVNLFVDTFSLPRVAIVLLDKERKKIRRLHPGMLSKPYIQECL